MWGDCSSSHCGSDERLFITDLGIAFQVMAMDALEVSKWFSVISACICDEFPFNKRSLKLNTVPTFSLQLTLISRSARLSA